jgi:hypothetical protein
MGISVSWLFGSPWTLLIPGTILVISLFVHQSAASEARELQRTWERAMELKIDSLKQVIGSRSGENSAVAAKNSWVSQPVFHREMQELEQATNVFKRGASGYDSGISGDLRAAENTKSICISWMIFAGVMMAFCALGLVTKPKGQ